MTELPYISQNPRFCKHVFWICLEPLLGLTTLRVWFCGVGGRGWITALLALRIRALALWFAGDKNRTWNFASWYFLTLDSWNPFCKNRFESRLMNSRLRFGVAEIIYKTGNHQNPSPHGVRECVISSEEYSVFFSFVLRFCSGRIKYSGDPD